MRFRTIWTFPGLPLIERLDRTVEWVLQLTARHLPRSVAYWSFIDTGARYIRSDEIVPEVRYTELLQRIDR